MEYRRREQYSGSRLYCFVEVIQLSRSTGCHDFSGNGIPDGLDHRQIIAGPRDGTVVTSATRFDSASNGAYAKSWRETTAFWVASPPSSQGDHIQKIRLTNLPLQ